MVCLYVWTTLFLRYPVRWWRLPVHFTSGIRKALKSQLNRYYKETLILSFFMGLDSLHNFSKSPFISVEI